ncbi:MAG: twin-arginine translocase TatA/TatE family subunit [Ignavibacteriaceae bacterium]
MFENIGFGELLMILVVVLVLFGAKKIPELAKGLGKGISEFKKGLKDVEDEINSNDMKETKTETKEITENLHKIS